MSGEVHAFDTSLQGAGILLDMKEEEFQPGRESTMGTSVELSISCRNLADMDAFSKSDPMVVCYTKSFDSEKWEELGRTEVIWNNLNPNFVKKFVIDYFFALSQKIRFEVYDIDSKKHIDNLSKHDFLGRAECTLGEVVSQNKLTMDLKGDHRKKNGKIEVAAEELQASKEEVTLQFCGRNLDKKDLLGKSDPFLLFSKVNEDGSFTVVHKTETVFKTLNPKWKPFTIPVRALCNGDYHRMLKIECYDYNRNGNHSLIGIFATNLLELTSGTCEHFECIHQKKKEKDKRYRNSGIIELVSAKVEQVYTFLDYVKGGTQIHCVIAIDFASSNGDPTSPESLHYISSSEENQYVQTLRAVLEIIQDYDSDKAYPVLGFGAKIPPDGKVSHDFHVNGNSANAYCYGLDEVLEAYQNALQTVQLHGPTNFAPCINYVVNLARRNPTCDDYFILVILTDGIITDMPQTCEAIVKASSLPVSIIIVGIGNACFEAMKILDGDDVRLSSRGQEAERDIVQFVPVNKFMKKDAHGTVEYCKALLAKEILAEIPQQFVSYMKARDIKPNLRMI